VVHSSRLHKSIEINDESYDLPISIEERAKMNNYKFTKNSFKLDRLEAKTLLFCINSLNILIQKDIDRYLKKDLSFRTSLFK